jgi:hypothetical protein
MTVTATMMRMPQTEADAVGKAMPRATETSLLDAESRLAGAIRWGNVEVLREMVAPEYQGYDVAGRAQNRTSLLSAFGNGKLSIMGVRLSGLRAKVIDDVGLVTGVREVSWRVNFRRVDLRLRFLDVFTWGSGGWRLLTSQDTRLPA